MAGSPEGSYGPGDSGGLAPRATKIPRRVGKLEGRGARRKTRDSRPSRCPELATLGWRRSCRAASSTRGVDHEFRAEPEGGRPAAAGDRVPRHRGDPGRRGLRGADDRLGRPALAPPGPGGPEGGGQGTGTLEPVHAPRDAVDPGPRTEPGLRLPGRAGRTQPPGLGGHELLGARHGEHGGAGPVRHGPAEGGMAGTAARGPYPLGVRHDRARRGLVGRHQHPAVDPPRRRRVRPQRSKVVDLRRGHRSAAPSSS